MSYEIMANYVGKQDDIYGKNAAPASSITYNDSGPSYLGKDKSHGGGCC